MKAIEVKRLRGGWKVVRAGKNIPLSVATWFMHVMANHQKEADLYSDPLMLQASNPGFAVTTPAIAYAERFLVV